MVLAVHKAALGSAKHAATAASAVGEAAKCLNEHHGSASGIDMPWQWQKDAEAWNTKVWVEPTWKGKAKGKGKDQDQTDKGKGKGKGNGGASGSGDVGKGKGKDAGKSKGKGKGAWWPCPDKRCAAMVGKVWMNPPADCQCSQCYTNRAAAPAL